MTLFLIQLVSYYLEYFQSLLKNKHLTSTLYQSLLRLLKRSFPLWFAQEISGDRAFAENTRRCRNSRFNCRMICKKCNGNSYKNPSTLVVIDEVGMAYNQYHNVYRNNYSNHNIKK